jgi:mRNA-degrading endonuclease RelE of RelBE toxin-antitoxin system
LVWRVTLRTSVREDLLWFGRKSGRAILRAALSRLEADPLAETKNLKRLRANPFAQRELRVLGRYRVLFNVDAKTNTVDVLLAGEKRGNALFVRGKEFTAHHEGHSPE